MGAKFNSPQNEGKRAAKNAGVQNVGIFCESKITGLNLAGACHGGASPTNGLNCRLSLSWRNFPHKFQPIHILEVFDA
jgi:hypothetical protein